MATADGTIQQVVATIVGDKGYVWNAEGTLISVLHPCNHTPFAVGDKAPLTIPPLLHTATDASILRQKHLIIGTMVGFVARKYNNALFVNCIWKTASWHLSSKVLSLVCYLGSTTIQHLNTQKPL